jgi:hypothetical protein
VVIDGNGRTVDLTGAANGKPLITVGAGVTLTLKNITLKGLNSADDGYNNDRSLINVDGGTLILEDGAVISDNKCTNDFLGGGVYVTNGDLIMNGGAISNNQAEVGGGGVYVAAGGKFAMSGGAISGNTCDWAAYGGGVCVRAGGEFIMSGGAISNNIFNNSGSEWGYGGGVGVRGGTFTMSGGSISGNSISGSTTLNNHFFGGGVGVGHDGKFTMKGGTISGNTAANYGGGVGVAVGTFTMKGGTISGNTAASYGGGVGVASGTFTKIGGGTIYGVNVSDDLKNIVGTRDTDGTVLTHNDAMGHAAYAGGKKRTDTADTGDDMDSGGTTGWE